jgi:hypothetical protein
MTGARRSGSEPEPEPARANERNLSGSSTGAVN